MAVPTVTIAGGDAGGTHINIQPLAGQVVTLTVTGGDEIGGFDIYTLSVMARPPDPSSRIST